MSTLDYLVTGHKTVHSTEDHLICLLMIGMFYNFTLGRDDICCSYNSMFTIFAFTEQDLMVADFLC